MKAAVFVRRSGANNLGHVGWAFQYEDGLHNAGAVENPPGTPISSPQDMGFWSVKTNNPVDPMRQRDYDEYKIIELPRANATKAWSTVLWVKKQWYTLLMGNCMDDTYNVLRAYGVPNLPLPGAAITPNRWFDALPWHHYSIKGNRVGALDTAESGPYGPVLESTSSILLEADMSLAIQPEWIGTNK